MSILFIITLLALYYDSEDGDLNLVQELIAKGAYHLYNGKILVSHASFQPFV